MIIDLRRFQDQEQPYWTELETMLEGMEQRHAPVLLLDRARRFHYLYERAAGDLARLSTFSSNRDVIGYLESLVSRAYAQVHDSGRRRNRFAPLHWFFTIFPQAFRRHINAFYLSLAITVVASLLGAAAMAVDKEAKSVLIPSFSGLQGDPAEHVKQVEAESSKGLEGRKSMFSFYIANNTKVAFLSMAFGMTFGIGTIALLFYNGLMVGAVAFDFIQAGQTKFLVGWLLPHGSIEIPAIILAGQAGLMLAKALIGWGNRQSLKQRMRQIVGDLATIIGGVAIMLVWAAVVEAFFSQYHEPILPYWLKIATGCLELTLLAAFLSLGGRKRVEPAEAML